MGWACSGSATFPRAPAASRKSKTLGSGWSGTRKLTRIGFRGDQPGREYERPVENAVVRNGASPAHLAGGSGAISGNELSRWAAEWRTSRRPGGRPLVRWPAVLGCLTAACAPATGSSVLSRPFVEIPATGFSVAWVIVLGRILRCPVLSCSWNAS